ncbi:MAG: putative amidohydrolase [Pseudomonadales bacterium]
METGCFVVASAQVGSHDDGRQTFGHSLVIDPWGTVLLDMGGAEPGLAVVDLDIAQVERVRAQIPSLKNERSYQMNLKRLD